MNLLRLMPGSISKKILKDASHSKDAPHSKDSQSQQIESETGVLLPPDPNTRHKQQKLLERASHSKDTSSFSQLPLDCVTLMIQWLDERSLLALAATSLPFFSLVMHSQVWLKLEYESAEKELQAIPLLEEISVPFERYFCCYLRQLFCQSVPPPVQSEGIWNKIFDPNINRYAAVVSMRMVELTPGFFNKVIAHQHLLPPALNKYTARWPREKNPDPFAGDAFSWHNTLTFTELEPLDEKALALIMKGIVFTHEDRFTKQERESSVPSVSKFIQQLISDLGSSQMMMWHDKSFKAHGLKGFRVVVLGESKGCSLQCELYANFCGGPYSSYSCGMG